MPTPPKEPAPKPVTQNPAELIGLVKRQVPVVDPKTKRPTGQYTERQLTPEEVLDFRVYPHEVVVVTRDGQKFRANR